MRSPNQPLRRSFVALHAQPLGLPSSEAGAGGAEAPVPDWVHLIPAGSVQTYDGRGPYRVEDAAAVIAASAADPRGMLIDENHATDLAAPEGREAPARGWITALEARADGIWGRVAWTAAGAALLRDRAYRALSPVIEHDKAGRVLRILRASLVNRPNLRGLAALNQETDMPLSEALASALGIAPDADEATALTAIAALRGTTAAPQADSAVVAALQAQLANVTRDFNAFSEAVRREKAVAFVDGAIARHVPIPTTLRDHYVARHMADPEGVEKELNAIPPLGRTGTSAAPPAPTKPGAVSLNAGHREVIRLMGIDPAAYARVLAAETAREEDR